MFDFMHPPLPNGRFFGRDGKARLVLAEHAGNVGRRSSDSRHKEAVLKVSFDVLSPKPLHHLFNLEGAIVISVLRHVAEL